MGYYSQSKLRIIGIKNIRIIAIVSEKHLRKIDSTQFPTTNSENISVQRHR